MLNRGKQKEKKETLKKEGLKKGRKNELTVERKLAKRKERATVRQRR